MTGEFFRFCGRSAQAYADLRRRIDACAAVGRSCEFPQCRMPAGCVPQQAVVGFFKKATGYLLYFRPKVIYRGSDPRLAEFFSHGDRMLFPTFGSFCDYLGRLPTCDAALRGTFSPNPAGARPAAQPAAQPIERPMAGRQPLSGGYSAQKPAFASQSLTEKLPLPEEAPAFSGRTQTRGGESPLFSQLKEGLAAQLVGQQEAVTAAAFRLWAHVSKKEPARPLSLIFFGPTGVGKSHLAKAVPAVLNRLGREQYQFVWTELNTFTEAHSAYRLTGAPPGYAGYDDPPVFEAVRRNPRTVFMFDELEKAHPQVLKVFMSLLDEGRCAARQEDDQGGRELDFRRCVFLFTTNADLSGKERPLGFCPPKDPAPPPPAADTLPAGSRLAAALYRADEAARRAMEQTGVLREIAGRFSGFIPFYPLTQSQRAQVTQRQIAALGREHGLSVVEIAPGLVEQLTPADALSARSSVAVLEGALTAAFCQYAGSGGLPRVRLLGTAEEVRLVPA